MQQDGEIDYRTYTLPQLREALSVIDKRRYPMNHRNLEAEIATRPTPPSAEGIATQRVVNVPGFRSRSMTRLILVGFCWFMFVWFVLGGVVAAVVATIASRDSGATTFREGYLAGEKIGDAFGRKYGLFFMLGGLSVAVLGTAAGVLPGTRHRGPDQIAQQAVAADRPKPGAG